MDDEILEEPIDDFDAGSPASEDEQTHVIDLSGFPAEQHDSILSLLDNQRTAMLGEHESVAAKAELFDQITQDPQVAALVNGAQAPQPQQAQPGAPQQQEILEVFQVPQEGSYEPLDQDQANAVRALMGPEINRIVTALVGQVSQTLGSMQGTQNDLLWSGLENRFPGASQHRDAALQRAQQHGLSIEEGLRLVAPELFVQAPAKTLNGKGPGRQQANGRPPMSRLRSRPVAAPQSGGVDGTQIVKNAMRELGITSLGD